MHCISQSLGCISNTLEWLGLYEPEIDINEAEDRLAVESDLWENCQNNKDDIWGDFLSNGNIEDPLNSLVDRAIIQLGDQNIWKGVAVDLGCGINSTTFHLLERGWKVYAVDRSTQVLNILQKKISSTGKTWIQNKQLILINKPIESFEFPEKVHLVVATESLSFCNPKKISQIFFNIKENLLPQGIFACSLYPYADNPLVDNLMRGVFGAWMTTKNVAEAIVKSTDFSTCSVTEGKSPGGLAKQFHIIAQK